MVTINDVAKAAGFSASTVSRALAGSTLIPTETRTRISAVADSLGYIPNAAAKSLKTKKTWNIGVISFVEEKLGFSHYLFANILDSFAKVMEESNYDITLISRKYLRDDSDLVGHCRGRNLDGVLIFCADTTVLQIQKLLKSNIPVVAIDNFDENIMGFTHCITSDNRAKLFELTNYIISQGHRDIVYITGQDIFVTRERVKGFCTALEQAGIDPSGRVVGSRYYNLEDTEEKLAAVLERNPRPTCIIVQDDYAAIKAYDLIKGKKLKIGEDVSIAGFDGLEISQTLYPKLTTVAQNTKEIGSLAANTLLKSIARQPQPFLQTVKATIQKGDSIGRRG